MRATIDKAGRLVIPKSMRDSVGLRPGPVEVEVDGAALRVEPVVEAGAVEKRGGRTVMITPSLGLDDDDIRALRLGDQR